jgi:acetyltransferase (GNAT) family protein
LNSAARRHFLRRVEAMSISGAEGHWALVPSDVARKLRPRVARIADGYLTLLETSDSLRMNRVIGLGHRGAATERSIDEILAFYRAARLRRFSLLLSPGPQFETITNWLRARGFRPGAGHALLAREIGRPIRRPPTQLRIARARLRDARTMVDILQRCFGIPASRLAWSLATATSPDYEHFLAWDGKRAVAAASLRVADELGWLGGAATLTRWRRRGAQSALIAARLRSIARAGCRWAWVETAIEQPGRPGGSRRNLLASGFEEVCIKPSWVYQFR